MAAPASPTEQDARPPGTEVAPVEQPRVPVRRVNPALGAVIQTFDDGMAMAKALAPSGALPKALQGKPADILTVMMYAAELGMTPVQGFRAINVVEGRPQLSGQYWVVRIRQAGHRFKVVEHTGQACTVRVIRHDEPDDPYEERFTLDDAVAQGLVQIKDGKPFARSQYGKPLPWETATKRMLLWRATGNVASIACPEVAYGFEVNDSSHEMVDGIGNEPRPSLAEVAANRERASADPEAYAEKYLSGPEAVEFLRQTPEPDGDITDAEVVEDPPAPPPPSADDLASMAAAHRGEPAETAAAADGGLFDGDGWPETRAPGSGLPDGYER